MAKRVCKRCGANPPNPFRSISVLGNKGLCLGCLKDDNDADYEARTGKKTADFKLVVQY